MVIDLFVALKGFQRFYIRRHKSILPPKFLYSIPI